MKRTVKIEAIVLKKKILPNRDTIVALFSDALGKVSVIAKGVKKITSRRSPHLQTANLISCILYKKDERYYLQETTLISGFSQIKNNREKLNNLYQYFFILERLLPENQTEPQIYNLLLRYLIELSQAKENKIELLKNYLNNTLKLLGYIKEDKSHEELIWFAEGIIHEKIPQLHL
ncbi:DNA repair protein RecO [Candidatus Roizmanbacteria bacterium RIFCSPHIGHO2_01_FULL_39_12c]|uniref:DNA repair protein RecO n=1 Tax=Candidatus Roizmanbacteria bacterium RIFCSPHIGHO2_01_FULL_39_12c TaxID=1802031 RepID=A0A1F7GB02_9BACT|nr:MAG: DNA repair protein RecO [Candidatus Roizmanbacteria bacterium RIFCSPHIGHO2_01_FULL_39_12c]OGK46921.1 MAG: DNA repair protein RecO [Candidatus Roizmanbacteria bacterium RIFCSPLOWO2_01_FULL_40_13]